MSFDLIKGNPFSFGYHFDYRLNKSNEECCMQSYTDEERYHPLVYAYRRGAIRKACILMGQTRRKLEFWDSEKWDWFITHMLDHFFPLFDTLNDYISLMLVNTNTNYFLKTYFLHKIKLETLTYHVYPFSTLRPRLNNVTYPFRESNSIFSAQFVAKPTDDDLEHHIKEHHIKPIEIKIPYKVKALEYKDPLTLNAVTSGHRRVFNLHDEDRKKEMIKRFYLDGYHTRLPKINGGKRRKLCGIGSSIEPKAFFESRPTYSRNKKFGKHTYSQTKKYTNYRKNIRRGKK